MEIMGAAEIASLLGVTRQRVNQLSKMEGFPAPFAQLQAGTFWRRADIERWMRETGRKARPQRRPEDEV